MNNAFCALPFTQFTVSSFNEFQLCCDNLGESEMFSDSHSILEYFNSDYINDKRRRMINGERLDICKSCWEREDKNIGSRRLTSLKFDYENQVKKFEKGEKLIPTHRQFKIKFGNLCNLKCVMCGPQSSSAWAQHKEKHGEGTWPIYDNVFSDKFYEDLHEILPYIKYIIISGGEPLMNDRYFEFLEWLIGHKYSNEITISTITNATKIPNFLKSYKKGFKNLNYAISIDGVGKKEEYIRTNTIWNKKVENIKALQKDFSIGFEVTVQTLNVGYIDDIQTFLKSNYNMTARLTNILAVPGYFAISCLPEPIKKLYLDKKQKFRNKEVSKLLKTKTEDNRFLKGIKFLRLCDKRNNTNLLEEWPEFERYY